MGKKPRTSRRSSPWVNRQKHSYLQMSSYVTPFRISPSPLSSYRQCYLKNLSPSVKVLRAAKILQNGNSIACCGRRALKRGEEGFCRDFAQCLEVLASCTPATLPAIIAPAHLLHSLC
ncbi:zinc finger SWIM domain-containing protein 7 isoform X5 [Pleurodeles waltl]|uniref:zinc finger SWIM domain-containing protein 7 isoform X5 n=1 Tax=Pleurodeles waltl TaxID=8319 RepID=UPI003709918B